MSLKCSSIGPSETAGKNVSAATTRIVPTRSATKSGPSVGKVPALAGTIFFLTRLPAIAWNSELAAVVVVDRGAGRTPAVFYVSVPSNLGTQNVTVLLGSLRLSSPR